MMLFECSRLSKYMDKKTKLETLPKNTIDEGKQVFLSKNDRVGDNPNKMVIGSGTSFKGSDINTDYIEIFIQKLFMLVPLLKLLDQSHVIILKYMDR